MTAPRIAIDPDVRARLAVEPVLVERKIGAVHEYWLDALDARTRAALYAASPTPAEVWLARRALADLPVSAPSLFPADLGWLLRVGHQQRDFALGRIEASNLGPRRAAIERCKDLKLDDEISYVRIACRVLAPHIAANRLAFLQLTRTQPRPIGIVMERELLEHSDVPLDQVPTYAALRAL